MGTDTGTHAGTDVWADPAPAEIVRLREPGVIPMLLNNYCGYRNRWRPRNPLLGVLAAAMGAGASTAVIEHRYLDRDYTDEYRSFYARTFRRYPGLTHRMHFFAEDPPADVFSDEVVAAFDDMTYLGYCVLRPVPGATVGRTMLAPAGSGDSHPGITCLAHDDIHFFGVHYEVTAVPFMAQDSQLGVCAHAAVWTVAYYHRLRYGAPRHLPGEIAGIAAAATSLGRPLPSSGLTVDQLCEILRQVGLPPLVYDTGSRLPYGETLETIACRYLDSAFPLVVATGQHCFVLVGYHRDEPGGPVRFICQDDEVGPYVSYENGQPDGWRYLIVPLPETVHVPAESAEKIGRFRLRKDLIDRAALPGGAPSTDLLDRIGGERPDRLVFTTSAIRSDEFKRTSQERGYDNDVARGYMRIPMPEWVWVVELVDEAAFLAGADAVVAEAVIDSTDHSRDMRLLAWRVPGLLRHWDTHVDEVGELAVGPNQAMTASVCATVWPRQVVPL